MCKLYKISDKLITKIADQRLFTKLTYCKVYRDFIIVNIDYPLQELKYSYWHKDDTDGTCNYCETIAQCMDEIDDWWDDLEALINTKNKLRL